MSRWGEEKTLDFVIRYRHHECLWNVQSPLYKDKASRENAYKSLLESLNDDKLDIRYIKIKIKNLRSIYHTELKKIKDSKRFGRQSSVYKPTLLWFDAMHSFLGESIMKTKSSPNTVEITTQDSRESSGPQILWNPELIHNNSFSTDDNSEFQKQNLNEATLQSIQPFIKTEPAAKKRPHGDSINTLENLEIPNVTQDEFYFFALSIAAQLRNMPLHIAIEAQSKIQSTLSALRLSCIISRNSSPSSS